MTAVIRAGTGRVMSLPGRTAVEMASGAQGGYGVTVRRVVIPPEGGTRERGPHRHDGCEEVIFILGGNGEFLTGDGAFPVSAGDMVVVSPGEPHRTRNTGTGDLVSLCFFPVPDLTAVSSEVAEPAR